MKYALVYLAGLITPIIFEMFIVPTYLGFKCAFIDVSRYVEYGLNPGYSAWNWAWLIPRIFWRSFWETVIDDFKGMRRTG